MEQYVPNDRDLKYENKEGIQESKFLKGINPEIIEGSIRVYNGSPSAYPCLISILSVNDIGKEELYRRSNAETRTGFTYEQFKESGAKLTAILISHFYNDSEEVLVKITHPDNTIAFRGVLRLTDMEQANLTEWITSIVRSRNMGNNIEDCITKKLYEYYTLNQFDAMIPNIVNSDDTTICDIELSGPDTMHMLNRTQIARFGFKSINDYMNDTPITVLRVHLSPDGRIKAYAVRQDNYKVDIGKPVELPLKDEEKQFIRESFVRKFGMSPEEYKKNVINNNDEIAKQAEQNTGSKRKSKRVKTQVTKNNT